MEQDRSQLSCQIQVLVADNSRFHTQLLVGVLSHNPDLRVLSSDLDAMSLMAASIAKNIDVFVLSAFGDGDAQRAFGILHEIRKTYPHTRAVILLDSSKPESVLEAFRAGARGVFDHRESSDMLCQCIRKIHAGQVWATNEQMTLVLDALASAPMIRAGGGKGMNRLSKREADVVRCLAEGLTNREIAERLGLSQHTVKNHLFHIFDKLGVSNRIELLSMTLNLGPAEPSLVQDLLKDPAADCDPATVALCEKAAEYGVLAAQLMLARISCSEQAGEKDFIRAYLWFSVVLDQLNRARNTVKKSMTPAQVTEAERKVRERLNQWQRVEPGLVAQTPSYYETVA